MQLYVADAEQSVQCLSQLLDHTDDGSSFMNRDYRYLSSMKRTVLSEIYRVSHSTSTDSAGHAPGYTPPSSIDFKSICGASPPFHHYLNDVYRNIFTFYIELYTNISLRKGNFIYLFIC